MGGKKSNHIRQFLGRLKVIRVWQLILIFIPLIFVAATLLRFDHLKMVDLRSEVLAADAAGNDDEIATNLQKLQDFVFSHIVVNVTESNGQQAIIFGTGPFYLEQQYLRAANAAIEAAESNIANDSNPNGNIYAAVGAICKPLAIQNGWAWNSPGYLNCWTEELAKYPESDNLSTDLSADLPSTELFRYNYASPVWAPSWAGFVILICFVLFLIILIRILVWCVLQIALLFLKKA